MLFRRRRDRAAVAPRRQTVFGILQDFYARRECLGNSDRGSVDGGAAPNQQKSWKTRVYRRRFRRSPPPQARCFSGRTAAWLKGGGMVLTESILERLDGVTRAGNGRSARCPAHEDRHASLGIATGKERRVLAHCHTGCSTNQVVAAPGLDEARPDDVEILPTPPLRLRDRCSVALPP